MTKDEPIAWGMEKNGVIIDVICHAEHEREEGEYTIPLYTTSQRTWVELTEEEIIAIARQAGGHNINNGKTWIGTTSLEFLITFAKLVLHQHDTWQDLTEEEKNQIWTSCYGLWDCLENTQKKLKEKNT